MTDYYVKKIKRGQMLWTSVPSLWRKDVCKVLESQGFVCYPDGSIGIY